jgi:AraC-like DNA-binding protein
MAWDAWLVRLVRGRAHRALTGVVGGYADFAEGTGCPRETSEVPGRFVVVIVDLDAGWSVEGERFGSFAGGLYRRPVRVRHEGSSCGVQFDLEPPAARAVLGVPAGELAHRTVALEDLLGRGAADIAERLHACADSRARFAILDDLLMRKLARSSSAAAQPDTERAWALLRARGGQTPIAALAAALGCSRRHLAKRFAADVGLSPKVAARLMRLEAARRRLGTIPLARLAAEHGFADQADLTREFRALGGAPPTAFPFLQDQAETPP